MLGIMKGERPLLGILVETKDELRAFRQSIVAGAIAFTAGALVLGAVLARKTAEPMKVISSE